MDRSAFAFFQGVRSTRTTLQEWNRNPWIVLRQWVLGSVAAAVLLLAAVLLIAGLSAPTAVVQINRPPIRAGVPQDALKILLRNLLVLALHAMACVAGFIAGSSLPMQAESRSGISRVIHERGARWAIIFVVTATSFSLAAQGYLIGRSAAAVAATLHTSPALLLLALLPHALPELTALFLPLAAWIIASRRGNWEQLLAATVVTVAVALPVLVVCACWEVYVAPHVFSAVIGS